MYLIMLWFFKIQKKKKEWDIDCVDPGVNKGNVGYEMNVQLQRIKS